MQVAQTTPRFLGTPSFVAVVQKLFTPLFRLSNPQGATTIAGNPTSFAPVPFWFQTPNGSGKLGISAPTAAAAATVVGLLVIWYLIDEYNKAHSTVRTVGNAVVTTSFSTVKRCLFVMANAILFGVTFWVLESCFLYTLEKVFHISVNNPQMYNILLTLLAASFYVMITQVVKEKWKQKVPVTIGAPRVVKPKENFEPTFVGEVPLLHGEAPTETLQDFLGDGENAANSLDLLIKPILILGNAGSGKTELLHNITTKANNYCQLPVHELIVSHCKPSEDALLFIELAINNVINDARHRGQTKGFLLIDDVDQAPNPYLIQALTHYLRHYAFANNPIKIIVIATATNITRRLRQKFDWCELSGGEDPEEQEPLPQKSVSFSGNESFSSLHRQFRPQIEAFSSPNATSAAKQAFDSELHTEHASASTSAATTTHAEQEDLLETIQKNFQSTSSSSSSAA